MADWHGNREQPPPWVCGLAGEDFDDMYQRRVQWSSEFISTAAQMNLDNTMSHEIPGCESDWAEIMKSRPK
jgi:hypothetical protein